jgi:hypothetical protein
MLECFVTCPPEGEYYNFNCSPVPSVYVVVPQEGWRLLDLGEEANDKDILRFAEQSGHFDFLNDPAEDIYGLDDGERPQISVAGECKEFCESRGLVSVLQKYIDRVKEMFSNIVSLSADVDYFMDDESSDEGHIAIRVEVTSDQKTSLAEYDKWVDWVISNIAVEQRGFFTLVVRRV